MSCLWTALSPHPGFGLFVTAPSRASNAPKYILSVSLSTMQLKPILGILAICYAGWQINRFINSLEISLELKLDIRHICWERDP